jgi:hypothetical protein
MPIRIRTDFDGGALGHVTHNHDRRIVASIARDWDQDRFNTQATWYYARFDGLGGEPIEVALTNCGSVYNGKPSAGGIRERCRPFVSDDGVTWRKSLEAGFDEPTRTFTMRFKPAGDTLWIAHLEPYVAADLAKLKADVEGHPDFRAELAGQSIERRDIELWTIGDEAAPHCVWLIARQHAWETHTSFCVEGAVRWLVSNEAVSARRDICWKIMPLVDPDGVVAGASRFNRLGWDTNRHWTTTDPSNLEDRRLRPEICAAKGAVLDWLRRGKPIDLHLNYHDTQVDIFVAHEGLAADPLLADVYGRMMADGFTGQYRHGSSPADTCQHALWTELGVRAALVELGTVDLPEVGYPTAASRIAFGERSAKSLAAAVTSR